MFRLAPHCTYPVQASVHDISTQAIFEDWQRRTVLIRRDNESATEIDIETVDAARTWHMLHAALQLFLHQA